MFGGVIIVQAHVPFGSAPALCWVAGIAAFAAVFLGVLVAIRLTEPTLPS